MSDPSVPGIRRRQLAIRLTELRKASGQNHREVASWTGMSQSVISKIENARQPIQVRHVRLLAQCYGVGSPEVDVLVRMAEESHTRGLLVAHSDTAPDFAKEYFELEQYAAELWVYEPSVIFGLFQTPEYVRAMSLLEQPSATAEEVASSVALRTARQQAVIGRTPPVIRLVLDEAVLRRSVGDSAVMAGQLRHLAERSQVEHITMQVAPLSVYPSVGLGFTVLRFDDDPPGMDVVYVEHIRSATYLEKPPDIDRHVQQFETISERALSPAESRDLFITLARDLWEH